jgi:HSP20 family protein
MFNRVNEDTQKRGSFFSRLTGGNAESDPFFDEPVPSATTYAQQPGVRPSAAAALPKDEPEGELSVDVYQTEGYIVVKAFIAGVQPGTLDISLSREMLTVSGSRQDEREVDEEDYFERELYWGSFSRTILLPEEVDVDLAEASEKHGILIIRLPKINKKKQTKLKVKSR